MAAPGHTPGSTIIVMSSGADRAMLLGDVVHCPIELLDDEWAGMGDVDPALARRTRVALARELEGSDVPRSRPTSPVWSSGDCWPPRGCVAGWWAEAARTPEPAGHAVMSRCQRSPSVGLEFEPPSAEPDRGSDHGRGPTGRRPRPRLRGLPTARWSVRLRHQPRATGPFARPGGGG